MTYLQLLFTGRLYDKLITALETSGYILKAPGQLLAGCSKKNGFTAFWQRNRGRSSMRPSLLPD